MNNSERAPRDPITRAVLRWFSLFTALRFRDFRLFWIGLTAQIIGQQMFQVTVGWLAFELTGSPAALALINLVGFVPRVTLTLLGGVFADRWNQQRLIQVAQALSAGIILTIATLAITENIRVWHLALSAFVLGVSQSIDEPARTAFFPRLLPDRSHIPSAVPLISLAWSSTRVFAPSIAGFVIAAWGADTSFLLSAVGAATMVAMLRLVHTHSDRAPARGNVMGNLMEGIAYVRADDVFSKIILSAFVYATFIAGYVFMLPVFADELGVGPKGLGVMTSAAGIGSLIGLGTFSFLHARFSPGQVIIMGLTLFAIALIGVAASPYFLLSVLLLGVTGVAHIYFQTSSNVILQSTVGEQYRGRVMSLYGLLWSLMLLSGTMLNLTAEFVGPRYALGGGAVVVLIYVYGYLIRSAALRHVVLPEKLQNDPDPSKTKA
jgi:MFS transporter, DHA1 family, staphyloferrin A biosynthesis exporter